MAGQSRHPHILKENARSFTPQYHIFVDTETRQTNIAHKTVQHSLKLGWAIYWDRCYSPGKEKVINQYFEDTSTFWDFLETKVTGRQRVYLWAHNMSFDFRILDGFTELKTRGWEISKPIFDSQRVLVSFRKDGNTLMVVDTFNFFKVKLADIGKDIGYNKGEVDFKTCTNKELKEYCLIDTEIVFKVVKYLLDFIDINELGSFRPTIASLAFQIYKHKFMRHQIFIHNNPEAIKLERASYKGGRCEAFRIGKLDPTDTNIVDVNSMYPYMMLTKTFPTKLRVYMHNPKIDDLRRNMIRFLCIADVSFTLPIPAIAVKSKRLLFPIGKIRSTLTTPEINIVRKYGKITDVHSLAVYDHKYIFEDYIRYFYKYKRKYKKEGNKSFAMFSKYMLNTLYGKFGQINSKITEIGVMLDGEEENIFSYYDYERHCNVTESHIGGKIFESAIKQEAFDSFVAIPAHVAAYARCYLWALMKKAGMDNIYYCDSDSLFVNNAGLDNLKTYINPLKIGYLELYPLRIREIKGAKWYITEKDRVIKGIRKEAIEIAPNTFTQEKFEGLRTSLRKGITKDVIVSEVKKTLDPTYKKGVVIENGKVIPFEYVVENMTNEDIKREDEEFESYKARAQIATTRRKKRKGKARGQTGEA